MPPDVRVEISGLRHGTHAPAPAAEAERVLRVRSFTLLGSVKVDRPAAG